MCQGRYNWENLQVTGAHKFHEANVSVKRLEKHEAVSKRWETTDHQDDGDIKTRPYEEKANQSVQIWAISRDQGAKTPQIVAKSDVILALNSDFSRHEKR